MLWENTFDHAMRNTDWMYFQNHIQIFTFQLFRNNNNIEKPLYYDSLKSY